MNPRAILGSTCLAALASAAVPALAQTRVTGGSSTPLATSSAGDVTIVQDAELELRTGTAITVNSNNRVTILDEDEDVDDDERGAVTVGGGNGATGILVQPGVTTTISNGGIITVLEDFEPEDEDGNGIADGAIASGTDRYGLRLAPGGTVTGSIVNSGVISVEGLNSAGIALDSALDGAFTSDGAVRVAGDNSTAIRTGNVSGNIVVEGSATAIGRGAQALVIGGDVGGSIRIQGSVSQQSSFSYDDDGNTVSLSRFDLRAGAPAAAIQGNVAGGIIIATRPADDDSDDDDEDNDGVDDDEEGFGSIVSAGNGPALLIGSDRNISIGTLPAAEGGSSLAVNGSISGNAGFSRTDAYGLVIGGQGGTVNLPGGIAVSGTISATTQDSAATALLINEGVTVSSLSNSGNITATLNAQGEGSVIGIRDLSGTLVRIENSGFITARGSSTDIAFAIDLGTTTSDVSITQFMNADDLETRADIEEDLDEGEEDETVYTGIYGNIRLGSGNDTLSADSGEISGNIFMGPGNDRLLLSNEAVFRGKAYFGSGTGAVELRGESTFTGTLDFDGNSGTLTIADTAEFAGTLTSAGNASVRVDGGVFGADKAETTTIGQLRVGAGGRLNAYVDGDTGTSSLLVVDNAVFERGAKISATITSLEGAEGSYVILRAGNLEGVATFDADTTELPYIFKGSLIETENALTLDIRRKTAAETGVTRAAASAYDAILTAALEEDVIAQSFLDITNQSDLQEQLTQMLPDHAGGLFDAVTRSTRLVSRRLTQGSSVFSDVDTGDASLWLEPVYWRGNRNATNTSSYKSSGWGLSGGAEWLTTLGFIGASYAFTSGSVDNNGGSQSIGVSQHDLGLFWRAGAGTPLRGYARAGVSRASFSSDRTLEGTADDSDFTATTSGSWGGWLLSGLGGATFDFKPTDRFNLQPRVELEWFRLSESSYTESGGGAAVDLEVAGRTSQSLSGLASLMVGYSFGEPRDSFKPFMIELEGGRRTVLGGKLGTTRANFEDGEIFSITPDKVDDSWTGELRLSAGGFGYRWNLSAGAEKTGNSEPAYSVRMSVSAHF